jgi:hypothetical protein
MSQVDFSKSAIIERLDAVEDANADLQVGAVYASLSAAAEVANVIAVTLQVKDFAGEDVEAQVYFHCQIFDANMLAGVVGSWRLAESGDGTEVSVTAKPSLLVRTSAAGAATLSVTDVAGGSGATVYLKVSPVNSYGKDQYLALTFD